MRSRWETLNKYILISVTFVLIVHKYNAISSVVNAFAGLFIGYYWVKNKNSWKQILGDINSDIKKAYCFFTAGLLISSLAIWHYDCIKKSIDTIYYSMPFILTYCLIKIHNSISIIKQVLYATLVASFYASTHMIYQVVVLGITRPNGLYAHPNQVGSMLDIVLPFVVVIGLGYLYNKKIVKTRLEIFTIIMNIVTTIVALFLTGSRGAIIGVSLGLIITGIAYSFKNLDVKKTISVISVLFVVSGTMLFGLYSMNHNKFTRSYDNERLLLVESSYNMWQDHKLFGVGLTNWKTEYQKHYILPQAKEPNLSMPHNVFAFYFATTGLVGGIGFCLFLLFIFKYLLKNLVGVQNSQIFVFAMLWALLAIVIHGMVECGITLKSVYRLFCGYLGITCAIIDIEGRLHAGGRKT